MMTDKRYLELMQRITTVVTGPCGGKYVMVSAFNIRKITDKAVNLDGEWFPISQLRKDEQGNLYATQFIVEKKADKLLGESADE